MKTAVTTAVTTISAILLLMGCCQTTVHAWADFNWGAGVIPSLNEVRFRTWMRKYDKWYSSKEEYKFRYGQFSNMLQTIEENNGKANASQKMSLNQYSDLTEEEFFKQLPVLPSKNETEPFKTFNCSQELGCNQAPSVNWFEKGFITKPKKLPCLGASYAFISANAVEATYKNQTGNLIELSPKQLMDCGSKYDMSQCDFGDTHDAFKYIQDGNFLETIQTYPIQMNDKTCKYNKNRGKGGLKNIFQIKVDPSQIKQALQFGPVTSVVNSGADVFKNYKSGIIDVQNWKDCDPRMVNLYVLIVGYGKDDNGDGFFVVKNNWGDDWGEDGFFRISDSPKNVCGILTNNYMYQISN